MTCLRSPWAECSAHWLLELAGICGAGGRALASVVPGKKPETAGAATRAADSPAATALRAPRTTTPRDCLRANLRILKSLRFIGRPPRKCLGLRFYSREAQS